MAWPTSARAYSGGVTEGVAEVNGARLWYEEAGSGPAVVLLHGHLIDSGQWDDQFPTFAREFRTVRYDARGFGYSDLPEGPFSFSDDLCGLLDRLGIEQASLIGNSGGGATAIDFALAHPGRLDALVPVGSALNGYSFGGELPPALADYRSALEHGDHEGAVELGLRIWADGPRRPDQVGAAARERTREMMARQVLRPDPHAQARWVEPPAVSRLSEIAAPTLVIVAEHDLPRLHAIADLIALEVPSARKEVLPDAGHHPNMEHPGTFNELVLSFLRRVADSRAR
jgi:3-oxoadipate enol-lactonase